MKCIPYFSQIQSFTPMAWESTLKLMGKDTEPFFPIQDRDMNG